MISSRVMWGVVSLVVLTTIAITVGTSGSRSQEKSAAQSKVSPTPKSLSDLSKFAVVDYDERLPENAAESDERKLKNKRYDNQEWVLSNPHPETARVSRYDESIPPPVFPTDESDLILVGNVVSVTAHLSNDKRSVYSEYTLKVDQILKNNASMDVEPGGLITFDRAGGYVRYPNGQKVLYTIAGKELPTVGHDYVLFLKNGKKSKNYQVLNLYELQESGLAPMDSGRAVDEIKGMNKSDFVRAINDRLSKSSGDESLRRKP